MKKNWKRNIILFLMSQAITLLGSSIVQLAIIWHVTLQTSSGFWVTILTLSSFLPQMVISLFSGAWADRYNRKKIIILSDSFIAVATFILAICLISTELNLIAIIIVSFIRSLGSGIQTPAINAVIPQIIPEENLLKFNGINSSIQSAIQFTAPAISGFILSLSSIDVVLLIDVVTAIIGIAILAPIQIPNPVYDNTISKGNLISEIKEGISYVYHQKNIKSFFIRYGLYIFLSVPSGFLAALFIERLFNQSYLYLTINEVVGFGGMFIGGLIISFWNGTQDKNKTFSLSLAGYGVFSIILGITGEFWQFAIMMFFISFCIPIIQSSIMSFIQENVDTKIQGRVFSLLNSIFSGVLPLGMLIFGPLADMVSIQILLIIPGILITLLGLQSIIRGETTWK